MIEVATQQQTLDFFKESYGHHKFQYYGFYNSEFNKIITDENLMLIPQDDRTATRAHGAYDVIYANKKSLVNLQDHVNRLFSSCDSIKVTPPFDKQKTKQVIKQVTEVVMEYHLRKDKTGELKKKFVQGNVGLRITISSGFGDFSVASIGKTSVMYICVFEPYFNYHMERNGVKEYVTKLVKAPKANTHSKTIDYSENAEIANQSKMRGGYQGIKALQNRVLLEAATANIAFVFGKQFATPRFETVIEGTTIKKCLVFLQELKQKGVIEKISFRDITIEQAYKADEMIVIGGDKIVPVLYFDDNPISKAQCGVITRSIQDWYEHSRTSCTPLNISQQLLD